MNIRCAIFDMDGTLLDSLYVWKEVGQHYLNSQGIVPPKDLSKILRNLSVEQAAKYFQQEYGLSYSCEAIVDAINQIPAQQYREKVPLKKGVLPFLRKLKEHHIKMCVATATNRDSATSALKRLNVLDYFEFLITCGEIGAGKDAPDIYLEACKRMDAHPQETMVFEDSLYCIQTARCAGFWTTAVYDEESKAEWELLKKESNFSLTSWEDAESFLEAE